MTDQPQHSRGQGGQEPGAGTPADDPLTGGSPGYLDEVAQEASEESQANLTDAGAAQDLRGPEIDPRAGGAGAG